MKSFLTRLITAVTSPFRKIIISISKLFNVNLWAAKIISPLNKLIRNLFKVKPESSKDYYTFGRIMVFKKVFLLISLCICAGVLIYFTMFAEQIATPPMQPTDVVTDINFNYNDMEVRKFTGKANIFSADGQLVYTGDLVEGVCVGNGTLKNRDGSLAYIGEFAQNMYNGTGTTYHKNGEVEYSGEFANNRFSGEGNLYYPDKTLQYSGTFQDGLYSGEGKLHTKENILQYEGQFSEGNFHGNGILYYDDGTKKYEGEFFKGSPQGVGSLYNSTGKIMYTGVVYDGEVDYRTLANSNLQEIENAFTETPKIFYTDTDSVYVYEQMGVIITLDCKIQVHTWEKPKTEDEEVQQYFYMPISNTDNISDFIVKDISIVHALSENSIIGMENIGWYNQAGEELDGTTTKSTTSTTTEALISDSPAQEYNFGEEESTQTELETTAPSTTAPIISIPPTTTPTPSTETTAPSITVPQINTPNIPEQEESDENPQVPDFITAGKVVYFEIDNDIWLSEEELDASDAKSKIKVKKITIYNGEMPTLSNETKASLFEDNSAPTIDDCVAIDYTRLVSPTVFSNIIFQMDKQNSLFVKLKNIDFAGKIVRLTHIENQLTYRYCYSLDDRETMYYYSIER